MAKRKKAVQHRRRRRVSGIPGGHTAMIIAGVAGGAVLSGVIQSSLGKNMNPKIIAGLQMAAGMYLPKMGHQSPLFTGLGYGLLAAGTNSMLHQFGVIKGFNDNMPITIPIAGFDDMQGIEENMQGIEQNMSGDLQDFVNGIYDEMSGDETGEDKCSNDGYGHGYNYDNKPVGLDY